MKQGCRQRWPRAALPPALSRSWPTKLWSNGPAASIPGPLRMRTLKLFTKPPFSPPMRGRQPLETCTMRHLLRSVSWTVLLLPVATACSVSAETAPKAEADWPLFRGNALQNGVAPAATPADLAIRWQFTTQDSVEGGAAIANGVVYVGSM